MLELIGDLAKTITVGYRSPFRLRVTDPPSLASLHDAEGLGNGREPVELELWGDVRTLQSCVGARVLVTGHYRVIPGGPAAPGSEAASRFVDGMIPTLARFEVRAIRIA